MSFLSLVRLLLMGFQTWAFGGIRSLCQVFPLLLICLFFFYTIVEQFLIEVNFFPSLHLTNHWKSNFSTWVHFSYELSSSWLRSSPQIQLLYGAAQSVVQGSGLGRDTLCCAIAHRCQKSVRWTSILVRCIAIRGCCELGACAAEIGALLEEEEASHPGTAEVWGHRHHLGCRRRRRDLPGAPVETL